MTGYETRIASTDNGPTTYTPGTFWGRLARWAATSPDRVAVCTGGGILYQRRNVVVHSTPEGQRAYRCESRAKASEGFDGIASVNGVRTYSGEAIATA